METFTDAASGLVQLQDAAPEIVEAVPETGTATQTELDSATITAMQAEIQRWRSENVLLKTELHVFVGKTKLETE